MAVEPPELTCPLSSLDSLFPAVPEHSHTTLKQFKTQQEVQLSDVGVSNSYVYWSLFVLPAALS